MATTAASGAGREGGSKRRPGGAQPGGRRWPARWSRAARPGSAGRSAPSACQAFFSSSSAASRARPPGSRAAIVAHRPPLRLRELLDLARASSPASVLYQSRAITNSSTRAATIATASARSRRREGHARRRREFLGLGRDVDRLAGGVGQPVARLSRSSRMATSADEHARACEARPSQVPTRAIAARRSEVQDATMNTIETTAASSDQGLAIARRRAPRVRGAQDHRREDGERHQPASAAQAVASRSVERS